MTVLISPDTILIPILGLFVGSFANVLIYRIPKGEEWVFTPSHCTSCGHRLRFFELVPVFSWLALRGACRVCKEPISSRYPLIEIGNSVLWLVCLLAFGLSSFLPLALAVSTALLVLSVIDIESLEIPDGINWFLLLIGLFWNAYLFFTGDSHWQAGILGFFCVSLPLLLLAIATKGGMGGGDIKLAAVCGLILGWQNILLTLALASILGTLIMLPLHLIKKRERSSTIPFGPFLSLGAFLSMCFGDVLIRLYLSYFF